MLTAPTPTQEVSHTLTRTPESCRRQKDDLLPQNSNSASTHYASIPPAHSQGELRQAKLATAQAQSSNGSEKLTVQQRNGSEVKADLATAFISSLQKQPRDSKARKKQTYGGEACIQEYSKNGTGEGFATTRSIPQERSLSKLRPNYLEANLREEEEMLKQIEEQALNLKQQKKKNKQLRKVAAQQTKNITASLSAIPAIKPKQAHKRGESCDLPLPAEILHSDFMQGLDRVNSEQEEEESVRHSGICNSSEAFQNDVQHSSQLVALKGELERQKDMRQRMMEEYEQKAKQLEGSLNKVILQLKGSEESISRLQNEKDLQEAQKKEFQQSCLHYEQQLSIKDLQIEQLNSTIACQTIKLQQVEQRCGFLTQQCIKATSEMEALEQQSKSKGQEYQEGKRKLERQLAQLSEDRRKSEQSYLKQIQVFKQKLDLQNRDQKMISDGVNRRQKEMINKMEQQRLLIAKEKQALQESNRILKEENGKLLEAVQRLSASNEEKEQARQTVQQYLANAEDHIRKVEDKYHTASKELTEKNVAYDFLWIQLKEVEQKQRRTDDKARKNSQEADPQGSMLQSFENESPVKQEGGLNHILSTSTLKDIKDLHGIMEQAEGDKHRRNPSDHQIHMQMPLTHRPSLNLLLLGDSRSGEGEGEAQAMVEEVQPSNSGNILLKNELSEAFSEENDEIEQMISNHNSNTSKMESSLGAFSEYSRAKSTQSALTHKQVEQEYQSKMKNSKLMAKLGKFKVKK